MKSLSSASAKFFALLCLVGAHNLVAAPEVGSITSGAGSVSQADSTTTINQSSQNLSISWRAFDVSANETVNFVQPSASALAVNKILSPNGSLIMGNINANGRVILINPNGIVFGRDATLNVGGLIASGLQINAEDFINGEAVFNAMEGAEGRVINAGTINAAVGGNVTLIGKQVRNDGLINAQLGSVNMLAGNEAVVTFDGDGVLGVRISEAILQEELGHTADDSAVINNGSITSQAGSILLSASTTQTLFSDAVNAGDLSDARSVVVHDDGSFTLGAGADVVNAGELNASATAGGSVAVIGESVDNTGLIFAESSGSSGGEIELLAADTLRTSTGSEISATSDSHVGGEIKLLGSEVVLEGFQPINTSGDLGGGNVYIGGDYRGENPFLLNAENTFIGSGVEIDSDSTSQGNGGRIIIWSDNTTRYYGQLTARGGSEFGDGGFAEVSGRQFLDFAGEASLTASFGSSGTLLLDPQNIFIRGPIDVDGTPRDDDALLADDQILLNEDAGLDVDITNSAITDILEGGTSVILQASEDIQFITSLNASSVGVLGDLILRSNDIQFNDSSRGISFISPAGGGNLTFNATTSITVDAQLNVSRENFLIDVPGTIDFGNPTDPITLDTRTTSTFQAGNNIILNSSVTAQNTETLSFIAGNELQIDLLSARAIASNENINISAGGVVLNGGELFSVDAGNDLIFNAPLSMVGAASVLLEAGDDITIGEGIATNAGDVTIVSGSDACLTAAVCLDAESFDLISGYGARTNLNGDITTDGGNITLGSNSVVAPGNIFIRADDARSLDSNGGDITINYDTYSTNTGTSSLALDANSDGNEDPSNMGSIVVREGLGYTPYAGGSTTEPGTRYGSIGEHDFNTVTVTNAQSVTLNEVVVGAGGINVTSPTIAVEGNVSTVDAGAITFMGDLDVLAYNSVGQVITDARTSIRSAASLNITGYVELFDGLALRGEGTSGDRTGSVTVGGVISGTGSPLDVSGSTIKLLGNVNLTGVDGSSAPDVEIIGADLTTEAVMTTGVNGNDGNILIQGRARVGTDPAPIITINGDIIGSTPLVGLFGRSAEGDVAIVNLNAGALDSSDITVQGRDNALYPDAIVFNALGTLATPATETLPTVVLTTTTDNAFDLGVEYSDPLNNTGINIEILNFDQTDDYIIGTESGDIFNIGHNLAVERLRAGAGDDQFNITGLAEFKMYGNAGSDSFVFGTGGSVTGSGLIDGKEGADNLVADIDTLTGKDVNSTWELFTTRNSGSRTESFRGFISDDGTNTQYLNYFTNFTDLIAGSATADTLVGRANNVADVAPEMGDPVINTDTQNNRWTLNQDPTLGDASNLTGTVVGYLDDGMGDEIAVDDSIRFSNFERLQGREAVDEFIINTTEGTGTELRGEGGNDVFQINAAFEGGSVLGGDDQDTFNVDVAGITASLNGNNDGDTFFINADYEGVADGGAGEDAFVIDSDFSGSLGGGGEDDTFTITSSGVFAGADMAPAINGDGGVDTLASTLTTDSNAWAVTGENEGTLTNDINVVYYAGIDSLVGSNQIADQFTIESAGSLAGSILGGVLNSETDPDPEDSLIQSAGTNNWVLTGDNAGTVTDLATGFSQIEVIQGVAGADTLTGVDQDNTWSLGAITTVSETLTGDGLITFSGMNVINGGNASDTFLITESSFSENIFGQAGDDTFTFSADYSGQATGNDGVDTFNISANLTDGSLGVQGGAGADVINITSPSVSAIINGGTSGGADTPDIDQLYINHTDTNTFTIDGTDQVTAASSGVITFSNIEEINAGNTAAADTFNISAVFAGTINGRAGNDIFNFTASGDVTTAVNAGTGDDAFDIDSVVTGVLNGGSGEDTFDLRSVNIAGTLNGADDDDTYNIYNAASEFAIADSGAAPESLLVSGTDGDEIYLLVDPGSNQWEFNDGQSGSLTDTLIDPMVSDTADDDIRFSGIENIYGADLFADTFVFNSVAPPSGYLYRVDARGQQPESSDTVILTVDGDVSVALGGTLNGVKNAEAIQGNGAGSRLIITTPVAGPSLTWVVTDYDGVGMGEADGINDGTVTDATNILNILDFGQWRGLDNSVDIFEVSDGASLTGTTGFNGGTGSAIDIVRGRTANSNWLLTGAQAGNISEGGNQYASFVNIEQIEGRASVDQLTGQNQENRWALSDFDDGVINEGLASEITFLAFESLVGGTNIDTIVGLNQVNNWTLTSVSDTTTPTPVSTSFSSMEVLEGNADIDNFVVGAAFTGDLNGMGGADTFAINRVVTGDVIGGAGGDAFTIGELGGATLISGGGGSDTLTGRNTATTWTINNTNNTLVDASEYVSNFTSIEILNGGTNIDTFNLDAATSADINGLTNNDVFNINAAVTGSVAGGADNDEFNFSVNGSVSANVSGGDGDDDLTGRNVSSIYTLSNTTQGDGTVANQSGGSNYASFTSIEALIGGSATNDELVGVNQANTWAVSTIDAGNVRLTGAADGNEVSFSGMEELTGNASADTFDINAAFSGIASGLGGEDSFDINADVIGSLNGGGENDSFIFGANGEISGSGVIDGEGGSNTLTGRGIASIYNITDVHEGNVTNAADTSYIASFQNIQTINGSSADDTLIARNQRNTWIISGAESGSVSLTGDTSDQITFTNFENLTGNGDIDTFNITGGYTGVVNGAGNNDVFSVTAATTATLNGDEGDDRFTIDEPVGSVSAINGGDDTDTLNGRNAISTWTIDGVNEGRVADGDLLNYVGDFASVENLVGSVDSADTFNFTATNASVVNIDAGASLGDSANYSAVSANIEVSIGASTINGLTGIERVVGNNDGSLGAAFSSSLTLSSNADANWDIGDVDAALLESDGINDGTVAGVQFIDFNNLIGSDANDVFTFSSASASGLSGSINGGANTAISADSRGDEIVGRDVATSWSITESMGTAVGSINGYATGDLVVTNATTGFEGIERVNGGTLVDDFTVGSFDVSGSFAITLDGGSGLANSVSFSSSDDVQITVGQALGGLGLLNFSSISAGATTNSTLTFNSSTNDDVRWSINNANGGEVGVFGGVLTEFSNFQNLVGTGGDDSFTFSGAGSVSTITGGLGSDSITGKNALNLYTLISGASNVEGSISVAGSNYLGNFSQIELLTGGTLTDTLQGIDQNNTWTLAATNSVALTSNSSRTIYFASMETLNGNNQIDIFNFNASYSGNINAGSGNDRFALNNSAVASGVLDGGAGDDTLAGDTQNTTWTLTPNTGVFDVTLTNSGGAQYADARSIQVLEGRATSDTIVAPDLVNTWNIDGANSGLTSSGSIAANFSGMNVLTGGALADTVNIISSFTGNINTQAGQDTITIDEEFTGTLDAGADNDTFNINQDVFSPSQLNGGAGDDIFEVDARVTAGVDGGDNDDTFRINTGGSVEGLLDGAGGNDTIQGLTTNSNWRLTDFNSGSIDVAGTNYVSDFQNVETLVGNASADALFAPQALATTFTSSNSRLASSSAPAVFISFESMETITGSTLADTFNINSAYSNTLNGGGDIDTFTISAAGFSGLANGDSGDDVFIINAVTTATLDGGADNDGFTIGTNGSTAGGSIIGNSGSDSLTGRSSNSTYVLTAFDSGRVEDTSTYVGAFSQIERLIGGSGTDELRGLSQANTWTISDTNNVAATSDSSQRIIFENIETLTGGNLVDTFLISNAFQGDIDAGDGNDDITLNAAYTGDISGGADSDTIRFNAAFVGTANGDADNDSFIFGNAGLAVNSAGITTQVIGGAGRDTLQGRAQSSRYVLSGFDAGRIDTVADTSETYVQSFSNIEVLNGASGADELVGTSSPSNWLVIADSTVTNALGAGILNFNGMDTLTGSTGNDTFTVGISSAVNINTGDGANSVTINQPLSGDITGGGQDDVFVFNAQASGAVNAGTGDDQITIGSGGVISNVLNAGLGTDSILGRNTNSTWTLQTANDGSIADSTDTYVASFVSVENLIGNAASDTLIAPVLGVNVWSVANAGNLLTNVVSTTSSEVAFQSMETLTGNGNIDTFTFNAAFSGIANGGANDDIFAVNQAIFATLNGGSGNDSFTISGDGSVQVGGRINGGTGDSNVLIGKNVQSSYTLTATNSGSVEQTTPGSENTYVTLFQNIDLIEAGSNADTLLGFNQNNTWTIGANNSVANTANVNEVISFSGVETLTGNDGIDTFNIVAPNSVIQTMNGENNADVFNLLGESNANLNGGNDADEFIISSVSNGQIDGGGANDLFRVNANAGGSLNGGDNDDRFLIGVDGVAANINGGAGNDEIVGRNSDTVWRLSASNSGSAESAGQDYIDLFTNINLLTGGTATDELIGLDQNNTWIVNGANNSLATTGVIAESIGFANFEVLTGRSFADTFTLASNDITLLNAGAGDDIVTINGSLSTVIETDIGDDQFFIGLNGAVVDAGFIDGGVGNDSLTGKDVDSIWTLTEPFAGTIESADSGADYARFGSIETLTAGNQIHSLVGANLSTDWVIASGTSTLTTNSTGSLDEVVSFINFDEVAGGEFDDVFEINQNVLSQLSGGLGADVFNVNSSLTHDLNGGDGSDTFSIAANTSVLGGATIAGDSGNDTLIVRSNDNQSSTWSITGNNLGAVASRVNGFTEIENITGGNGADSFIFTDANSGISGLIDGGESSAVSDAVVDTLDATIFVSGVVVEIGEDPTRSPSTVLGISDVINVNNIESIVAADLIDQTNNWISVTHDNDVEWAIASLNTGTVTRLENAQASSVVEIPNTQVMFDNFGSIHGGSGNILSNINQGVNISGTYIAGSGLTSLDFSEAQGFVVVNLNERISALIGNDNTLLRVLPDETNFNVNNDWLINGDNSGSFTANFGSGPNDSFTFDFSGVNQFEGGDGVDTFTITENGRLITSSLTSELDTSLSGAINGGGGVNNLIASSASTEFVFGLNEIVSDLVVSSIFPNIPPNSEGETIIPSTSALGNRSGVIDLINLGQLDANPSVETGIQSGSSGDYIWEIGTNAQNTVATNGQLLTFTGASSVQGGSANDTFNVLNLGDLSNQINTGAGNDVVNLADIASNLVVSLATFDELTNADATFYINGSETIIGNNILTTLVGDDSVNTWRIDAAVNQGSVTSSGNTVAFEGVNNLTGGALADTFEFRNSGSTSGVVRGGDGNDTLDIEAIRGDNLSVTFDGGNSESGSDRVLVSGDLSNSSDNSAEDYRSIYSVDEDGDEQILLSSQSNNYFINYTNVERVDERSQTADLVINAPESLANLVLDSASFTLNANTAVGYQNKDSLVINGNPFATADTVGVVSIEAPQLFANGDVTINNFEINAVSNVANVITADDVALNNVFNVGTNDEPLQLNASSLVINGVTGSVFVSEFNDLDLSGFSSTNEVSISAGGNITSSGNLTSTAPFTIDAANIDLGVGNNLSGVISLISDSGIVFENDTVTNLGDVAAQSLDITSEGAIQDTGTIRVTDETTLDAGTASITLDSPLNDFNTVRIVGGADVQLVDVDDLSLATVASTGDLEVASQGLIVSGEVNAQRVNLSAGDGALLLNNSITATLGNVVLTGAEVLQSDNVTAATNIIVEAINGDIAASNGANTQGSNISYLATGSAVLDTISGDAVEVSAGDVALNGVINAASLTVNVATAQNTPSGPTGGSLVVNDDIATTGLIDFQADAITQNADVNASGDATLLARLGAFDMEAGTNLTAANVNVNAATDARLQTITTGLLSVDATNIAIDGTQTITQATYTGVGGNIDIDDAIIASGAVTFNGDFIVQRESVVAIGDVAYTANVGSVNLLADTATSAANVSVLSVLDSTLNAIETSALIVDARAIQINGVQGVDSAIYTANAGDVDVNQAITATNSVVIDGEGVDQLANINAEGDVTVSARTADVAMQADTLITGDNIVINAAENAIVQMLTGTTSVTVNAGQVAAQSDITANVINIAANDGDAIADGLLTSMESLQVSGDSVLLNQNVTAGANAVITANNGDLIMASGTVLTSGDTTLAASGTSTLGQINATTLNINPANDSNVNAGSVNQQGDIIASGDVAINAADYTATNGSVISSSAGGVSLASSAGDVLLNEVSAQQAVDINSGGALTLEGAVNSQNASVDLAAVNSIELNDDITSATTINVASANGNVNQQATVSGTGDIAITAGGAFDMTQNAIVQSTQGNIALTGDSGLNISLVSADAQAGIVSLISSNGGVTDANGDAVNVVAGQLSSTQVRSGIGSELDPIELSIDQVSATSQTGGIYITNDSALTVNQLHSNGNIDIVLQEGDLVLSNPEEIVYDRNQHGNATASSGVINAGYIGQDGVSDGGTISILVENGNIFATGNQRDVRTDPDIAGFNVSLSTPQGNIGELSRILSIYANDTVQFLGRRSVNPEKVWAFGSAPLEFIDNSDVSQDLFAILGSSNDLVIEIETLGEIDPAVFTQVRNYSYDDISILMPQSQRYDGDEDDES